MYHHIPIGKVIQFALADVLSFEARLSITTCRGTASRRHFTCGFCNFFFVS